MRKIISLTLVAVMLLSAFPFGVLGAEENNQTWSKKTAFDEFESGKVLDRTFPWNMGGSTTGSSSYCQLVSDPQGEEKEDKAILLKSTSAFAASQASFDCNVGEASAYTTDMFVSASVLADESTKLSLKIFGAEKKGKKDTELFTVKDGKFFVKVDGKLVDTGSEMPLGKWVDLYVSIELGEKTYSISIDGEAITNEEGDEAFKLPYAFASIYKVGYYSAGANSEAYIDDFFFATAEAAANEDDSEGGASAKTQSKLENWENNITVINSVLKDRLIMAEGSPKFFNNMVAGHYVEGNNSVYPVNRGDYYLVPARSVANSLGLTFAYDEASKKVTFTKDGKNTTMTVGSKDATVAGKKATLSVAPEMVNGALMVPVNEITEAAGKKLYIDDGDIKLFVIGSTAKPFNSRKKLDLKSEIIRATYYERPDVEKVIADMKATPQANQHPRIYITKDKIEELKVTVRTDPFLKETYERIKEEAKVYLKKPLPEYHDNYGVTGERDWYEYIEHFMLVYWIDGGDEYLQRSKDVAIKLSAFPHYGPYSSLAEAEAMESLAMAYDWMYDYLTADEKKIIKTALVEKRMKDDLLKYKGIHEQSGNIMKGGWVDWGNNFTTHGNQGVMFSIAALWDEETALCKDLLKYFFRSIETAFVELTPDGGGREGIGYLLGGTVTQSIDSFRLLTDLTGTDYNYLSAPHFKKALESVINMYGSGGVFRYADESRTEGGYPKFMWIGKYLSPLVYERRLRELKDYPETCLPTVVDLIDYDPNFNTDVENPELGVMYRKSEAGSFRNSFNPYFNTFVGFKGGDSVMSHSHRDLGSFVFHTDGIPWFDDHGMIFYLYGNKGTIGSMAYNHRAEGHNVMLFRNVTDLTTPPEPDENGMIPLEILDMEEIPVGGTPAWDTTIQDGSKLEVVQDGDNKVLLFSSPATNTSTAKMSYSFKDGLCTEGFALEYDIKINHMGKDKTGRLVAVYSNEGEFYDTKSASKFRAIQPITPEDIDGFKYELDTWYHVKLVFTSAGATYDMYVDGKRVQKNKSFMMPAGYNISTVQFETGSAEMEYMLDNLKFTVANNDHNFASVSKNMQIKDDQSLAAVSKITNFVNGEGAGFASVDLGAVYPSYTKDYQRAYGLFGNREVFVMRDEATVIKDCETWWFGHTARDITIAEDGKSAILTDAETGLRLWVGLFTNGPEKLTTTDVRPFNESPIIEAEVRESMFYGHPKLTIMNNRKAGEKIAFTVMMTPLYGDEVAPAKLPEVKPIAEWKDEPYTGARLPDLLIDGVPFDGFDPNQRYYAVKYKRYDIDPQPAIPQVSVPEGVNAVVKQAEKMGDTASITVSNGADTRTYYVKFSETVEKWIDPSTISIFEPPFEPTGKILNAGDYQIAQDSVRRSLGFTSETSVNRIDNWFDGDIETNHSVSPFEAFEDIDLGDVVPVSKLEMVFANGDKRSDIFSLYYSLDGENWEIVLSENQSSGKGRDWETFSFPTINTRWLRIVSHGNSKGSQFCNISELRIRK